MATNTEIQAILDGAQSDLDLARADLHNAETKIQQAHDALEPAPTPIPPTPTPSGLPRYGGAPGFVIINDKSTAATINAELDKWKDIGCQYLRVDLLESAAYLAKFHTVLSGCQSRGMKLMCCLRGSSGPYGATSAAAFAKRMAVEFGSQLIAYEYVNEPNLKGNKAAPYTGGQYGGELAAVYAAIKSVDSKLVVATCGMGWDPGGNPVTGRFSSWWPGVYSSGGKDHFDLFNVHLYDHPSQGNWTDALSTHAQYGQGKPIVVTEAGSRAAQATVIPAALKDQRVQSVCIYNMMLDVPGFEMWKGTVGTSPGYQAYKATPKV
jgi:hypothetical protein